jgi:hypothetical protein
MRSSQTVKVQFVLTLPDDRVVKFPRQDHALRYQRQHGGTIERVEIHG